MPDAPTATYVVTNENGNVLRTIPNVLADVRQTGCATTSSTLLTVADSTVLYPGMGVYCHEVPAGTFIAAIKDATTVVLSAPAAGTEAGIIAIFKGFQLVTKSVTADRGTWRNTISGTTAWDFKQTSALHPNPMQLNGPWTIVPATFEGTTGAPLTYTIHMSDELATSPALRTKTEPWSFWVLVSTGGHLSIIPFDPEQSLHLKSLP